jgi:hypothetical protein
MRIAVSVSCPKLASVGPVDDLPPTATVLDEDVE